MSADASALYGVYGASGCGRGVMPFALLQALAGGVDEARVVFIDDHGAANWVNGRRVVSYVEFMSMPAGSRLVSLAIANGTIRSRLAARCEADAVLSWTVTAPGVVSLHDVEIGEGAILCPFVTLTANIRIGRHFHANLYSYVEHDCRIGDFVTFGPAVKCNGNVWIDDFAYIGAGAMLRQGRPGHPLRIGRGAVVGMGAVVTRDVPADTTVAGNPARTLTQK